MKEARSPLPEQAPAEQLSIAICIATSGRAGVLTQCLKSLLDQTEPPDELLICPARPQDCEADAIREFLPDMVLVHGNSGLPAQRNALLRATRSNVVIFFDDDFIADTDFIEQTRELFTTSPDVIVATGEVLADGILGPGLEPEEGRELLAQAAHRATAEILPVHNAYGCNMVIRMAPVREAGITFDEALPLYGWLEDVDFSRRLAPYGRIVKSSALRGVHLGSKKGRSPGRRLGYSQIANPLYLHGKGTVSVQFAVKQMSRNIAANAYRSFRAEPWVDRRGRLTGNLLGLRDLVTRRLRPGRILELD